MSNEVNNILPKQVISKSISPTICDVLCFLEFGLMTFSSFATNDTKNDVKYHKMVTLELRTCLNGLNYAIYLIRELFPQNNNSLLQILFSIKSDIQIIMKHCNIDNVIDSEHLGKNRMLSTLFPSEICNICRCLLTSIEKLTNETTSTPSASPM